MRKAQSLQNSSWISNFNDDAMESKSRSTLAKRKKKKQSQDETSYHLINSSKSQSKNNESNKSSEDSVSVDKTTRDVEKPICDTNKSDRFDNTVSTDLEEFASESMNVVVDVHREYKADKCSENTIDEVNISAKGSPSFQIFSKTNTLRDKRNEYQKFSQVRNQKQKEKSDDIEIVDSIDLIEEFDGSSTIKSNERRKGRSIKKNCNQSSIEEKPQSRGKWGALQSQTEELKKPPRKRWSKDTSVIRLPEVKTGSWAAPREKKFPLRQEPDEIDEKSFLEGYDNAAFVSENEEILRIETDHNNHEDTRIEMKRKDDIINEKFEKSKLSADEKSIPNETVISIETINKSENSNFVKLENQRRNGSLSNENNVSSRNRTNHETANKRTDSDKSVDNDSDASIVSQTIEDITVRSNYRSSEEISTKDRRSTNKKSKRINKKSSIDSQAYSSQQTISATEDDDPEDSHSRETGDEKKSRKSLVKKKKPGNHRRSKSETEKRKSSKNVSSSVVNSPRLNVTEDDSKKKRKRKKSAKYISVMIHRANMLEVDYITKHPMVKVHIVNAETGEYLKTESGTYLQPMITSKYDFKEYRSIVPAWEEELVFEHDFDSLLKTDNDQVMILFEIVDLLSFAEASFNYDKLGHEGCWYKIAWAFLKPVGRNNVCHINKKVRLQLYKSRKSLKKFDKFHTCEVYTWWKTNIRQKYPSSLFVTVTSIDPPKLEPVLYQQLSLYDLSDARSESQRTLNRTSKSIDLPKWTRLSAQSCKVPNEITFETEVSENGCFFVAFSNNGKYLACTHSEEQDYPVVVYEVEAKKIHVRFSGHKTFIYSLNWSDNDNYLLSVSSDQTARIWDVQNQIIQHVEMMPHPSYVYCGKFDPENAAIVATGCYDRIARIWTRDKKSRNRDLNQELEGHEGFINSMCFQKNSNLLTADSVGIIILWIVKKVQGKSFRKEWHISRKIKVREITGVIINTILLHPLESRLLVHSRNNGLRMLDLATGVVLQKYNELNNQRIQSTACISPCGGLILCGGEDSTLNIWNLETGSLLARYTLDKNFRAVTCVDYHPYDHVLALSTFGSPAPVKILRFNKNVSGEDIGLKTVGDITGKTAIGDTSLRILNTPVTPREKSRSSSRIHTPEAILRERSLQSSRGCKLNTPPVDESSNKVLLEKDSKRTDTKMKLLRLNETEATMKSRSANRLYNIIEKIDRILSNTSRSSGDIESGRNHTFTKETSKDRIFTIQNENIERRRTKTRKNKSFAYWSGEDHSNSYFESSTASSVKPEVMELERLGRTKAGDSNTKKRSQSANVSKSNGIHEDDAMKHFSDSTANYRRNKDHDEVVNMFAAKSIESSFIIPVKERKVKDCSKNNSFNNDRSNSSGSAGTYVVEKNNAGRNDDDGSMKLLGNEDLIGTDTENDLANVGRTGSDSSAISNATFTIENEVPIPMPRRKKNLS
ncbi:PREDICTED: jouberin-like [Dufourea novaeangliae]|uniref:jouberin-like n=1 Tax=Dufourea novaeangliae TaxID=178035 RepID=UPI0007675141|nr:PREDICTED: jouberin-like [Dufourea novaeangliae]